MPETASSECLFCRIAGGDLDAVLLHEDESVVAFLDVAPIRPGHTQIIPRAHIPYFEDLPSELAGHILRVAQGLARRLKVTYGVPRVAFLFTGGDVEHAHAHLVPLHADTDITSGRYLVSDGDVAWRSKHLLVGRAELEANRDSIGPSSDWLDAGVASGSV